ncbi:unnamed protein product [Polarella glacialis]|uniref:Uncharacterized protein n=1 Tax=Polarella glacialis TaxID=89957 RepID=A0A813IUY6_POLGL|nr:unnamed protein product [Polarella glacialis]
MQKSWLAAAVAASTMEQENCPEMTDISHMQFDDAEMHSPIIEAQKRGGKIARWLQQRRFQDKSEDCGESNEQFEEGAQKEHASTARQWKSQASHLQQPSQQPPSQVQQEVHAQRVDGDTDDDGDGSNAYWEEVPHDWSLAPAHVFPVSEAAADASPSPPGHWGSSQLSDVSSPVRGNPSFGDRIVRGAVQR